MISGRVEGMYAWISLNYMLGLFSVETGLEWCTLIADIDIHMASIAMCQFVFFQPVIQLQERVQLESLIWAVALYK